MKKEIVNDEIEVSKLIPYAKNTIIHDPRQVQNLAASIKEFGFTNPVLVDEEGVLIAGHGRLLAAELLGLKKVPCRRFVGYSENEQKAYRLVVCCADLTACRCS